MLQCVAVRCSALQCVAVRCMQCVAVSCSALQCSALQYIAVLCCALQCVAVSCSVLQCVAHVTSYTSATRRCLWSQPPMANICAGSCNSDVRVREFKVVEPVRLK